MSLWCDKYRPTRLTELDFNQEQAKKLKLLISNENFPHLFIHGTSGSGKKTRVNALLFELFDVGVTKLRIDCKIVEANSGKKISQKFVSSNYHLEVNPSENGFYDRVVIQELIKEVATTTSLSKKHPFKVIVITDADRLTREAQQSLRRTLEKYVSTCRVILVGERSSRIIPALKSRCLMIRNSAPTNDQILSVLNIIANKESVKVSSNILDQIVQNSDRNLRRAILIFQAYAASAESGQTRRDSTQIITFKWQTQIYTLAKKLAESQSVKKVAEIRSLLYELQTHLIPAEVILRLLTYKLLNYCLDDQMKAMLISMAADCDHRISLGSKSIIHLELFAVRFMTMFRCTVEKVALDLEQSMDFD